MSTINSQQPPPGPKKTCGGKGISICIRVLLLLVIVFIIWLCFAERGQEMLGNIANKGLGNWLVSLGGTQIERDAAAELEKANVIVIKEPPDQKVTSVNFVNCLTPSNDALKLIAKLRNLTIANLTSVEITDDQLTNFSNLDRLTTLVLNGTKISDSGMAHLTGLPNLNSLNLSHTKISDKGLEQIARIPTLVILDVSYTGITDQGMKHIANIKQLNWLRMMGTKITDAGFAELASLPELKRVTISDNMTISQDAIEQLEKNISGIFVDRDNSDPYAAPANGAQAPASDAPAATPEENGAKNALPQNNSDTKQKDDSAG
ncbi:MAG TPA: hypothetical protein VIH42_03955 [Thermoguttaceae bacterium]